ncbi:cytochrome ubiquinol oxidase subunit II [Sphingomonas morindae]|uniref:Cytochrome ubiquinol oxidase subunit II n=1 Tax=Sphingomonas morindae TaxID=1541170 RepID=A0ABY4X7E3_9SPHN|nr:cytochrome ubiquinol oxidase subunit II [Sphingomonas morindae]USI72784.1 cytochrome ubiquinol oxidase subunit II [Sphingomonas morindae]
MADSPSDLVRPIRAGSSAIERPRGRWRRRACAPLALAPLLGGCAALRLGVVNHAGPVAAEQWHLYLIVAAVLVFVAGPVLILVPLFAWHYRLSNRPNAYRPDWGFSWPLEILIWVPPLGIVIGLGFLLWFSTHRLDPYRPLPSTQPPLEVQAVALDWKWLFIYPDQRIATVNQLAIPVGRPVHLSLTSGTVMQSLLIPQLAGQIYAMAGMRTQLNLAASRAGVFRGENTQFNGEGFQDERFDVLALSPEGYARWIAHARAVGRPLDEDALRRLRQRAVEPRPRAFSAVPPDLFRRMMIASTRAPQP